MISTTWSPYPVLPKNSGIRFCTMKLLFSSPANKVLLTLVNLLFANPLLKWESVNTHVELFAGDMQVTKSEWEAMQLANYHICLCVFGWILNCVLIWTHLYKYPFHHEPINPILGWQTNGKAFWPCLGWGGDGPHQQRRVLQRNAHGVLLGTGIRLHGSSSLRIMGFHDRADQKKRLLVKQKHNSPKSYTRL